MPLLVLSNGPKILQILIQDLLQPVCSSGWCHWMVWFIQGEKEIFPFLIRLETALLVASVTCW